MGPLLTLQEHDKLRAAVRAGMSSVQCSLDLARSVSTVSLEPAGWTWREQRYPYLDSCKDGTIYHWSGSAFEPVSRYTTSLIKLVPTRWGAPTFAIDGIKMLPTEKISPWDDARRKVALIEPRGKTILDTCGGLGYFAAWCLAGEASRVLSYEKNPDVIWLRGLNPWSPQATDPGYERLLLTPADVIGEIALLEPGCVDAALHDPPRFGIAGELYSRDFYEQLIRVLRRKGKLFHYTGTPNRLTSGRDVPAEVAARLQRVGFATRFSGDGVLAMKK